MENINKNLISTSLLSLTLVLGALFFTQNNAEASYTGWQNEAYVYCYNGDPINGCGNGSSYGNTINNPIPSIYSISPSGATLNTNTTITISGSNFVMGSTVRLNNTERSVNYVNSGTLQVQLYPNDLSTVGGLPISVYNPGPGGGMSNTLTLNVTNTYTGNNNGSNNGGSVSKTKSKTVAKVNKTTTDTNTSVDSNSSDENSLAANAIFGAGSFIPNNFLQWLVVFILILLIVFLWRKIYVTEQDRSAPLKHA